MNPLFRYALIAVLITLSSCNAFLDVTDNIERSFRPPEKLSRIREPVKKGVKLSALWVGHATVLLQIYDKVFLTDPLFTNNVAQVLRRYYEPGISIGDLDKLDYVLISHSHMDHYDLGALGMIEEKFPGAWLIFPEGVEDYLPDYGMNYSRFRMWNGDTTDFTSDTKILNGVKFTSVASVHWGGRYGLDGKLFTPKGFCGFIIEYKDVTVYFSSDTAYDEKLFRFLGRKYKIDLTIMPIIYCNGCREINQGGSHLYPMGILNILEDTGSDAIIPTHYGTFTDPEKQYPVLREMLVEENPEGEKIKILKLGEQIILKNDSE